MKYDEYGQPYCTSNEVVDLIYKNPDLRIENFYIQDPDEYNRAVKSLHAELPILKRYMDLYTNRDSFASIEEYDIQNQSHWFMPDEFKNFDVEEWLKDQCATQVEIDRVVTELEYYKERNLLDLLRFLKYLIDVLRKNNIVWGVGRGSSVASFCLYLLGIHKIHSIKYNLDIKEFLK